MYGQSYRLSHADDATLGSTVAGPGDVGEYTNQPGMLSYYEICERIEKNGWQVGQGKKNPIFSFLNL